METQNLKTEHALQPDPDPEVVLVSHIVQKGFQTGSVIGLLVVAPAVLYWNRQAGISFELQSQRVLRALALSAVVGTTAIGGLGMAKVSQLGRGGIADRGDHLQHNPRQQRLALFSQVLSLVGGAVGVLAGGPSLTSFVGGATAGCAAGVLAHVASKGKMKGFDPKIEK